MYGESDEDVPLASLQVRPNNNNVNNEDLGLDLTDINDNLVLDPDYFPVCDLESCRKPVYSICDSCSYVLCEDHFTLGSCEDRHSLNNALCTKSSNSNDNQPKNTNPSDDQCATCEIGDCREEMFAACPLCFRFLCFNHLDKSLCIDDHQQKGNATEAPKTVRPKKKILAHRTVNLEPESFEVDGSSKEGATLILAQDKLKNRKNKKKMAKEQRNRGEQYVRVTTKKTVSARNRVRERCNGQVCKKFAHKCSEVSDEERQQILTDFYGTESLQLEREYIVRYVKKTATKRKTSGKEQSRRSYTFVYFLPKQGSEISVCKKFFMNTLCVSEKMVRTSLSKIQESGVLEGEKRGGRSKVLQDQDKIVRDAIINHINRFPRVESHYCRTSTSKEYLHPDLSLYKMVEMFNRENKTKNIKTSYFTYSNVFREMNLGFHHPKKDQCGLCNAYTSGDPNKKADLEQRYQAHISEKKAVRAFKQHVKDLLVDESCVCATFDLQQIILLPIAADSKLFYHRRLTNYNMTVYNIANKDCSCYVWHEGLGRRGSCEIASCLYDYLIDLDNKNVKDVFLFSDGCSGQNKNSAIATMLLHVVSTSKSIRFISLKFFEPYHGQNEGDSPHSAKVQH